MIKINILIINNFFITVSISDFFKDSENLIYSSVIVGSVVMLAFFYSYKSHIFKKETTMDLKNSSELLDYSQDFLYDLFTAPNFFSISEKILTDPYFYNYLRNFFNVMPSPQYVLLDLNSSEKLQIYDFMEFFKKNGSYEDFKKLKLKRELMYNFIQGIKKYIYLIDQENY